MAQRPSGHPEYRALAANEQAALRGEPEVARRRARPTLAPRDDIAPVLNALSSHLHARGVPRGLLHLGGGSVLAAAWSHRTSTDIDLWLSPERAPQLLALAPDAESWGDLFSPPGHRVKLDAATTQANGSLVMTLDDVPVSLFTSTSRTATPPIARPSAAQSSPPQPPKRSCRGSSSGAGPTNRPATSPSAISTT